MRNGLEFSQPERFVRSTMANLAHDMPFVLGWLMTMVRTYASREGGRIMILPVRVLSILLVLTFSLAADCAAAVIILPDQVTTVPGACTAYQTFLGATGATEPNGMTHPGACQYTAFMPTFGGKPWADYLADVTAWKNALFYVRYDTRSNDPNWPYVVAPPSRFPPPAPVAAARPYTIRGYDVSGFLRRRFCAEIVDFGSLFSATVQSSRLNWNHGSPPATPCAREWNRVNPALTLSGRAAATADQVVQQEVARLTARLKGRTFCGTNQRQAETELATEIEWLTETEALGASKE